MRCRSSAGNVREEASKNQWRYDSVAKSRGGLPLDLRRRHFLKPNVADCGVECRENRCPGQSADSPPDLILSGARLSACERPGGKPWATQLPSLLTTLAPQNADFGPQVLLSRLWQMSNQEFPQNDRNALAPGRCEYFESTARHGVSLAAARASDDAAHLSSPEQNRISEDESLCLHVRSI